MNEDKDKRTSRFLKEQKKLRKKREAVTNDHSQRGGRKKNKNEEYD